LSVYNRVLFVGQIIADYVGETKSKVVDEKKKTTRLFFDNIEDQISEFQFTAHSDSIVLMEPLHKHACIITASLDGYKRVWNLDQECLGEISLSVWSFSLLSLFLFTR
jgi:hypothetical protein